MITMREFMAITKALSAPTRVGLLLALRKNELCVCHDFLASHGGGPIDFLSEAGYLGCHCLALTGATRLL